MLLWDINTSGNPDYAYKSYEAFNLADQDGAECKSNFRVEKQDIPLLYDALQIPEFFTCYQGTKCSGIEGLCIALRRFAYPCRYSDLIPLFGRSVPELSMISNQVTKYIYELHGHRVLQWNLELLQPNNLQILPMQLHKKEQLCIIVLVLLTALSTRFVAPGKINNLFTMDINEFIP